MVMLFANFYGNTYTTGLAALSQTIVFFQQTPVFTHSILPELDHNVDRLTFELVNLDLAQLNSLMTLAGTKYLPSVVYKVRTLPFLSRQIQAVVPAASGLAS